jgi:hypothetical protein
MKRIVFACTLTLAAASFGRSGPECARTCQTALKAFEKQCKDNAAANPNAKASCDAVAKKFDGQCKQACTSGQKPKKPSNTNSF